MTGVVEDILAHARDLERRDAAVAARLSVVASLAEAVASFRSQVDELQRTLRSIPAERERLALGRRAAEDELERVAAELERAEALLADLERSRRRRRGELERATKETATARETLVDAHASAERVMSASAVLDGLERDCAREAHLLADRAAVLSGEIRAYERVAADPAQGPGAELEQLEGWASQSRAALFVARGTLETEREQIVVEANVLGTVVLGETLGASSVAVVRQRLEQRLGVSA